MAKNYRPCIAFKLNYCDGGKNSERIGFCGICSDTIIKYNILTKKREWCSNENCACRKYFDKNISRKELETYWDEYDVDFYTCYESAALRDWFFEAGADYNGKPRSIRGAEINHLGIFTTVEPNKPESDRMIVAMFIIGKVFEGNDEECGYVGAFADSECCLEFSPNEARQMKFWKIYQNPNAVDTLKWGSGLFRYFTDKDAVKFLKMAVEIKKGTADEELAKDFLHYYIKLNKI